MEELLDSGNEIPNFCLKNTYGSLVPKEQLLGAPAILICFISNTCPHVLHIRDVLVKLVREFEHRGVITVGISPKWSESNQTNYFIQSLTVPGSAFHLLFDQNQTAFKMFDVCFTPDFFVYNKTGKLIYHGQMDDSRPDNNKHVTGFNLRCALEAALHGTSAAAIQKASYGSVN